MNHDQSNETYVMLRHKDLLLEAERERLAATAQSGSSGLMVLQGVARFYRPALAWLGRRLMDTGRRLQAQSQRAQADEAAGW